MFSISIRSDENYILVNTSGIVSLEAAKDIMKSVSEHPDFSPDYNRLYNFGDAIINWGIEDINQLILYIKNVITDSESMLKVAFVNSDSTEQALLDLFLSLAANKLDRSFRLFANLTDAQEWIVKSSDN